jgi:hypothetical protein
MLKIFGATTQLRKLDWSFEFSHRKFAVKE